MSFTNDVHVCEQGVCEDTLEHFIAVIRDEYKRFHTPAPSNLQTCRYTDLNYSVRVKVLTRLTRDVGVPFNRDDFNHVAVGRLTVADAFAFVQKKVQEAKAEKPRKWILIRPEIPEQYPHPEKAADISKITINAVVLPLSSLQRPPGLILDPTEPDQPFKF